MKSTATKTIRDDFIPGCADCESDRRRQKRNDRSLLLAIAKEMGEMPGLKLNQRQVLGRWAHDIRDLAMRLTVVSLLLLFVPVLSLAQQPCSCETPLPAVTSGVIVKIEPVDQLTYPVLSSLSTCQCKPLVTAAIIAFLPQGQEPSTYLAQQPQQLQIVSNCVKGVYDECEFVPPHWYYRVGTVWTRDDGVVGKPPVVPVVPCPVQQSFKEPSRYDLSFLKDARTYTGIGVSFGVTGYDIGTSRGYEATRFYRGSDGQLNRGKYLGITALTNVALLPLDLQRDHRWRWVSFGLRVGLAGWRMKSALGNGGR